MIAVGDQSDRNEDARSVKPAQRCFRVNTTSKALTLLQPKHHCPKKKTIIKDCCVLQRDSDGEKEAKVREQMSETEAENEHF